MGKTNKKQQKAAALKEKKKKTSTEKTSLVSIQKNKKSKKKKGNKALEKVAQIAQAGKTKDKSTKKFAGSSNAKNTTTNKTMSNINTATQSVVNKNSKSRKKKNKNAKIQLNQPNDKGGSSIENFEELDKIKKKDNKSKKKKNKTGNVQLNQVNTKVDRTIEKLKKLDKIKKKKDKARKNNASSVNQTKPINGDNMKMKKNSKMNIDKLKEMLATKEKNEVKVKKVKEILPLRERMMTKLKASRFRYLNETLYNNSSTQSKKYFKEDPDAFRAYHDGYKQQVAQWPLNPLDVIIESVKNMPSSHVIADFGCGEALLAASVPQKVHSFDLISVNERVLACDVSHTPLLMNSVHVVVFCLSLMGTNLGDYIVEANRILKKDGILKIAEIESRFDQIDDFIKLLNNYGFTNTWKDLSQNLFYFLDFKKVKDVAQNRNKLPQITLKSCAYKKR